MTNVFERARAIRMSGEPWQNAVQRAGSQIRYETQVGGAKPRSRNKNGSLRAERKDAGVKRETPVRTLPGQNCVYNKTTARCRLSAKGKRSKKHQDWKEAHQGQWARLTKAGVRDGVQRDDPTAKAIKANRDRFASFARHEDVPKPANTPQGQYIQQRYNNSSVVQDARRRKAAAKAARGTPQRGQPQRGQPQRGQPQRGQPQGGGGKAARWMDELPGNVVDKPRRQRSDKGKSHKSPIRTLAGKNCLYNKKSARCRLSAEGKKSEKHEAYVRAVRSRGASEKQIKARAAFKVATQQDKGPGTAPARRRRVAELKNNQYGGYDGYSNTSSTRSSDFTSVSDATSYSQNGGSWTSNDSSSLW